MLKLKINHLPLQLPKGNRQLKIFKCLWKSQIYLKLPKEEVKIVFRKKIVVKLKKILMIFKF
jgi:hypothetical protein